MKFSKLFIRSKDEGQRIKSIATADAMLRSNILSISRFKVVCIFSLQIPAAIDELLHRFFKLIVMLLCDAL